MEEALAKLFFLTTLITPWCEKVLIKQNWVKMQKDAGNINSGCK